MNADSLTRPLAPAARWLPLIGLLLPCPAPAQAVDAAPATDEDVYVLSPFTVSTTKDLGYLAQNTLAGSRLNTSLADTAAQVSVLTPEFLSDIGATNMSDVILFSANSVPDYGDAAPNFNGNPLVGNDEWLLRIRGLPATYARNYFEWQASSDFYNVERIDESRGPNAILFGFGSAGGIVNTTTKRASVDKDHTELTFLAGSWERWRGTLDTNVVLIPGSVAIRVNLMDENHKGWRQYEDYAARRGHIAGTWKISDKTTVRAEFETGQVKDNVPRPWLAIDQAWLWRQEGRPTYDSAQWDWPVSDEITQTWSEHMVYVENDGSVMNWQGMPYTYLANQSWAQIQMTPENLSIVPRTTNSMGPGANRDNDYVTYSAWVEHQFTDDLSMELAYNHQWNDFRSYDPNAGNLTRYGYQGDATEIWGDASNWLPTWAPNPYAGRLYVENNWTRRTNWSKIDNLRATGAYNLDTGSFGKHRIALMGQHTKSKYYSREDAEVWAGAPFDPYAEFDSNRVFRRYYFEEGNASDIRVPDWRIPLVGVTDPVTGKTLTSTWVPNQEINNSDQSQDTLMAALQSHFLDERIVTTLGYRYDKLDYSKLLTARGSDGAYMLDPNQKFQKDFEAKTLTAGIVGKIGAGISAFANYSDTRQLPNTSQRVIGYTVPPMPKGSGSDFGLKFDILGSKLYATVDYYTTKYDKTTEWGNINADVTARNTKFLDAFVAAGLITTQEADAHRIDANGYLENRKSEGWEFEVIANPMENWRITANFSINKVVKTQIMQEVVDWEVANKAYWLSVAPESFLLGGGDWDTLGANIGWMEDSINTETAFNGKQARGERKYGGSLYTRYDFRSGALKGFYLGGGARYQSPNTITWVNDELIKGRSLFLADALLGYGFAPREGIWVDIQLNVSNVFDSRKDQIYTVAWWDATRAERIGMQEPRSWQLTTRISF